MSAGAYLISTGGGSGRQHPRQLIGPLYVKNALLYDQTGPRRVEFYSDFCLQRIGRAAETTADVAATVGRQGCRFCFCGPSESPNWYPDPFLHGAGYWSDRIVTPAETDDTLIPSVRMLAQRGLMAHLFGSYNFGAAFGVPPLPPLRETWWPGEEAFHQRTAAALRREGLAASVGLVEWFNEWNLTSPYGGGWDPSSQTYGSPETYAHAKAVLDIYKSELGCPVSMGAPGEEDKTIAKTVSVAGATVAALDFARGMSGADLMHHYDRAAYDGRYHGKYLGAANWVVEPPGPESVAPPHDMYIPLQDPASLFGLHADFAVTAQAVSYFCGPGVRHYNPPEETYGFKEFPALMTFFPEDVGLWNKWTWFRHPADDKQFVGVFAEAWVTPEGDSLIDNPPQPYGAIEILLHDGTILTRLQDLPKGWTACAIRGRFA